MKKTENTVNDLIDYMIYRSKCEEVTWGLSKELLQQMFDGGIRNFFGVILTDDGTIVTDTHQTLLYEVYKYYRQVKINN